MSITRALTSLFSVQYGRFRFWQTIDCADILYQSSPFPTQKGCYFNNPGAPYGLLLLPPHDDEIPDEYWGYPVSDGELSATWHMKSNDVVVLVGRTPPRCSYFGFTNYLYSRHLGDDWIPVTPHNIHNCPQGDRCELFASLDDSINMNRGINLPNGRFDQTIVLVVSPSMEPMNGVVDALIESGVSPDIITTFSLPGAELRLGVERDDDTLTMLMRMAFFDDEVTSDYFDVSPFDVFRITYANSTPVTPFERKPLVERATPTTDASLIGVSLDELRRDIRAVAFQISSSTNNTLARVTETESSTPDNGFECIENGTLCQGDCRDTHYPFTIAIYRRLLYCQEHWDENVCPGMLNATLVKGDSLFVVGVNHALTNMSSYMSVAIYDLTYFWGVSAVGNEVLDGSASHFVQPSLTDTMNASLPYLYVYEFSRVCEERPYCQEVASSFGEPFIPFDDPVGITERLYDNPLTHVGPEPTDIIPPYVIHIRSDI
jgi:hypothetical protein